MSNNKVTVTVPTPQLTDLLNIYNQHGIMYQITTSNNGTSQVTIINSNTPKENVKKPYAKKHNNNNNSSPNRKTIPNAPSSPPSIPSLQVATQVEHQDLEQSKNDDKEFQKFCVIHCNGGQCKFGDKCKYKHDIDAYKVWASRKVCKIVNCSGNNCYFKAPHGSFINNNNNNNRRNNNVAFPNDKTN